VPKNGLVVVGGEAKLGKTFTIFSGYAKALACQENLFENPDWPVPQAARVLAIEQELGPYILQKRVQTMFANSNLKYYAENLWAISKEPDLKLDAGFDLIRRQLDLIQPNILILDPIANFHTGNENAAQEVEALINQMKLLLREYRELDLSIIFTHHFGKPPAAQYADDVDRLSPYTFRGSSKWYDAVDTAHTIIKTKTYSRKDPGGNSFTGWQMKNRFTLRANECPDDFFTQFNFANDQRVIFERYQNQPAKGKMLTTFKAKPIRVVDSAAGVAVEASPGQEKLALVDLFAD
jgi:RecA-family ATPase